MIPKSRNRFSDKIMLKTKNLAHADINQGVAYGTPSSNFRSRRRLRAVAARAGWGRRYIICCTAVEMFGQALLARSTIAR
jgi:hypothetical protein